MLSLILNKTLKGHCKTRWSSKKMGVMSLNLQIIYVYKILKGMSEDIRWNFDTKSGADALLNQIDYQFICLLIFWTDSLVYIDRVNVCFQKNIYIYIYIFRRCIQNVMRLKIIYK